MFQIPNKKIFVYQLFFFSVLTFTFLISLITTLTFVFPPTLEIYEGGSDRGKYNIFSEVFESNTITKTINKFPDSLLLLIIALNITIFIIWLFIWSPSLSGVITRDKSGRMAWAPTKFGFPERIFNLKIGNKQIKIKRNRTSLNGLLMKNFNLEVHFDKESADIQRMADFTGMKRQSKFKNYPVLGKTVHLKLLPLQVLQLRAFLESGNKINHTVMESKISQLKRNSNL